MVGNPFDLTYIKLTGKPRGDTYAKLSGGAVDPFSTIRGYGWDALFIAEELTYTDLGETTLATNGQSVYRWVSSDGLSLRFSQATSGDRPIFTAGEFGDRSALVFSGTDTMTYASNVLLTGDHTLFMVCKYASPGGNFEGPIKTRNADAGDDRVILLDGVFAGAQQRLYTTPVADLNPPTTGAVLTFDVATSGGAVWWNTTKTGSLAYPRTNIDQVEIRPSTSFSTLSIGFIGYILKSKLTGGDSDISSIIAELQTLYEV